MMNRFQTLLSISTGAAAYRKLALEHMRCKIETASERVSLARSRKVAAEAALQIAADTLSSEENHKTALQEDMSTLICQNSQAQHARLAELTDRLEAGAYTRSR
jgi:phosphopantothenoylcysteine synthetase/decarboxylase